MSQTELTSWVNIMLERAKRENVPVQKLEDGTEIIVFNDGSVFSISPTTFPILKRNDNERT